MPTAKFIPVQLPRGADPSAEDLERLTATCEAVADLRFDAEADGKRLADELAGRGWKVQARLAWVVEARRDREVEQAIGRTRAEALAHLIQLLRVEEVGHLP